MNFSFNDDQLSFRDEVREFTKREITPYATELDQKGDFPWKIIKKMSQKGYLGIPFPEEFGGLGRDTISYLIAIEEFSKGSSAVGVITTVHTSVGTFPIYLFGTEEQKLKFLTPLARGEKLGAFALTEPQAGSDAAAICTTASKPTPENRSFILNGSKIFITNGNSAEILIIVAITDKSKTRSGISAFIVEKGTPGFSVAGEEQKMGLHASEATELVFENCEIPTENLLGQEGDGFKVSMVTLDTGRLGIAAQALGVAQAAFEESLRFSRVNHLNGKPLNKHQSIQFMFADMATELEAARLLMYKAAFLKDQNLRFTQESAMAKVFATEVAMKVTNRAMNILGELGYTDRSPLERYLRDVKVTEIYEGTSEIQRLIIGRNLLK